MAAEPVKPKKKVYVPKPVQIIRNATDLQRIKLQKLMEHPDRPVVIPEPPKERTLPPPPDFNRNVMGSSAGAGSGEFHVYRHLRRREYARQKLIAENADKEDKDVQYHDKLQVNRSTAEERTAKKRQKRLKKKLKMKLKKLKKDPKSKDSKDKSELGEKKEGNANESCSQKDESESESDSDQEKTKNDVDDKQNETTSKVGDD